ncbi:FAD-binding protein [Bifidobacterium actinocoloniiforme]|nr:FAD-binding protein [Bifidobacterium actinocoloniiforme]AKV55898.1 UDP-N-acetylenolpyruvoylglucosamine reductase [Bifidobacterium actinocoloniiforme DSM 22766]
MPDATSKPTATPTFADLTTIGVGGAIASFASPRDRVGMIEAVEGADSRGLPLCVIGGGSNLLAADEPFEGLVVRDARQEIHILDEAAPVESAERTVHVGATAGTNWDDLVAYCLRMGLSGIEGLSGIPGTVGASVVQNIGAYGQEAADSVESVEVWDRQDKAIRTFGADQMEFGYRDSLLKSSMYRAPGRPDGSFFPTPRYVVLSVTLVLSHSEQGRVDSDQLARALGVEVGASMPAARIREAVLDIRARKGMLEDPGRYTNPWMRGCRESSNLASAIGALSERQMEAGETTGGGPSDLLLDRHSCGSFFTNPILPADQAARLPEEAPRFPAPATAGEGAVKTSAAWLIDHAGFHKGYGLPGSRAALSSAHTLALTNRGGASAVELAELAHSIQAGVLAAYGVALVPEPVLVGLRLD